MPGTARKYANVSRIDPDDTDIELTRTIHAQVPLESTPRSTARHSYNTNPDSALSSQSFFSVRGLDNVFIYFWIAKDLSWTQSWYYPSWVFGICALAVSIIGIGRAVYHKYVEEAWHQFSQFLWLLANFVWCIGDVHDVMYRDEPPIYERNQAISQHTMEVGMCFVAVWYLLVLPFKLIDPSVPQEAAEKYQSSGLTPRFSCFRDWDQYENIHILLWQGKDYAWNTLNKPMWVAFTLPTLLISADFIWVTGWTEGMIVDHAHYIAQGMWVLGNMAWAIGELFTSASDDPLSLWRGSRAAVDNARWYSSWILLCSYVPILALYCAWARATSRGRVGPDGPSVIDVTDVDNSINNAMQLSPPPLSHPVTIVESKEMHVADTPLNI